MNCSMIPNLTKRISKLPYPSTPFLLRNQPRNHHNFHSSIHRFSSKPSPSDASTGVDPGYSSSSTNPSSTPKEYPPSSSTDPFPLPFSKQVTQHHQAQGVDLNSKHQSDGLDQLSTPLRVPGRENEDRQTMIARLIYQTRKRGTLETDLILSTFAKKELSQMDDVGLKEFDALLDEPDWDIFYWCTDRKPVPERWAESFSTEGRLGHKLRIHTRNDEKAVRWMPEL